MHSSTDIEYYKKVLYYLARTKRDCISAQCVFNWNIPGYV
jgi:hypothetical protein